MKKRFILKVFLLLAAFILLACGDGGDVIQDKAITINVGPEPNTIDPGLNVASEVGLYIMHVFEGLVTRDKENKNTYGAAQSWNISDDGLTYTFNIRENAKWSDGEAVTAHDFVYAWQRVVDPATGSQYSHQLSAIKNAVSITAGDMPVDSLGVEAVDDKTLKVVLETPTPYFIDLLNTYTYFPVRRDIIEEHGDDWTRNAETYIGNGAFKMTERNIDDRLVMMKNEHYWDYDSLVPEKLVFILMQNENAAVAGIKEGSLDFADKPAPQDIPGLIEEGIAHIENQIGTYFYVVNTTEGPTKDPRVRRALSLVIDRNYIVEEISKGGEVPAAAWVPLGINDAEGDFRENGGDYFSLDPADYEANIAEAKELLAEAGYPNGEGFPVLEFLTNPSSLHTSMFEAVQQMWKDNLGVDSTMGQEEWAVFQQTRYDKDFTIARHGYSGNYNDPISFIDQFVSDSFRNNGSYSNAKFDEIVRASRLIVNDEEKRMASLHEAEAILFSEMGLIPIFFYTQALLMNPGLKDVVFDPFNKHRFHYAYIEE